MARLKDRTSDARKLSDLAQVVKAYRWVQRRLSETLAQGIDAGDLIERRDRLGREMDRLVQDALVGRGVDLFDGCEAIAQ